MKKTVLICLTFLFSFSAFSLALYDRGTSRLSVVSGSICDRLGAPRPQLEILNPTVSGQVNELFVFNAKVTTLGSSYLGQYCPQLRLELLNESLPNGWAISAPSYININRFGGTVEFPVSIQTNANAGSHAINLQLYDRNASSIYSEALISITTESLQVGDTEAPSVPGEIFATNMTTSSITIGWSASTDNVGVAGYKVVRNGALIASVNTNSFTDTGLSPNTGYAYQVAAFDAAGNQSPFSNQGAFITGEESNNEELKAFPTADGFGKNATGGRGGVVLKVTNLNDSGPGSFREAVSQSGSRTIVFEVGGTINLTSDIIVSNGDLTIAGQTAPGDGIALYGRSFKIYDASNIIVRYMRFRGGDSATDDSVRLLANNSNSSMENIIFDHCSISWGGDENIGIGGSESNNAHIKNITFQRSIISEGFDDKNVLLFQNVSNASFTKNLLANSSERSVTSTTCKNMSFEMIDNVVYGTTHRTRIVPENIADYVGNQFITNPAISLAGPTIKVEAGGNCSNPQLSLTKVGDINNYEDDSLWTIEGELQPYVFAQRQLSGGAEALSDYTQVKNNILSNVGANLSLDSLDQHIINDVINKTGGHVNSESQTIGLPSLSGGVALQDSDNDGMPDAWEQSNGLNANDASDRNGDLDNDGYTNLEEYLNSITP